MLRYIVRRLAVAALLAWGVLTVVFLLLRMIPGDVVQVLLAEGAASPELIQARRQALGLDEPLSTQYARWLVGVPRFDLGTSFVTQRPIGPDLAKALPRTLELVLAGGAVGLLVGIPAGGYAASRHRQLGDLVVTATSMLGLSIPGFVTATFLLLLFGLFLKWVPTAGYVSFGTSPWVHARFLLLPAVTLGIHMAAVVSRFSRSAMLEVLGQDYVRTARAKGLGIRRIQYRHVLRNALIPIITIVGLESGVLLGGTIIVEYVFNWPGMSTLLIQGVSRRDYPMVQGVVLVIASLFLLLNLLVDIVNAYVDPRIRYS